jgi:hypothetical protein
MPVTGRNFARRTFLMALAAPLVADTHQDVLDFLGALTAALSEGNGSGFLDRVDHAMPDYYKLEQYIDALTSEDEVSCSIDMLKQEGDEQAQTLQLDWFMQIHPRDFLGSVESRRQTVKIRLERKKKKWKIVSLEPITLFAPPGVR